jgi:hypothetical protein
MHRDEPEVRLADHAESEDLQALLALPAGEQLRELLDAEAALGVGQLAPPTAVNPLVEMEDGPSRLAGSRPGKCLRYLARRRLIGGHDELLDRDLNRPDKRAQAASGVAPMSIESAKGSSLFRVLC